MKYIQFKGLFRDVPFWSQLVLFLFLLIFSSLTFLLLGELFLDLFSIENRITRLEINQLFSAIGMFIIAPLAISYLFSYHPFQFLSLNRPNIKLVLLALLCFITSIPFVNYITVLNESMHFPSFLSGIEDWMRTMEEKNGKLTLDMLSGNNWYEILLDIIVLALIPAIGEELLFRGAIQNGLYKLTRNTHWAIWITAFIFSTIHLQFFGFFPRMIMGALFGYLLIWGGSIWIPIFCHFINNLLVIITSHLYPGSIEDSYIDNIGKENLGEGCISLLLFIAAIYLFYTHAQKANQSIINSKK